MLPFEKSFASHEKSKFWSVCNEKEPQYYALNSHKKAWFDCDKCNHKFEMPVSSVSSKNAWCNYCANRKMCYEETCITCYNKSFASHEKSNFWSDKNEIEPRKVFKKTAIKYWFKCNKCVNEFKSKLCHVSDGSWCPKCRYKTEDKLHKILLELYPNIKDQYKADWCKILNTYLLTLCWKNIKLLLN